MLNASAYTLYRAPIGGFAGQEAELRFTVFSPDQRMFNNVGVDSFEFNSIPEPSTWALLALGGALFCSFACRRKTAARD